MSEELNIESILQGAQGALVNFAECLHELPDLTDSYRESYGRRLARHIENVQLVIDTSKSTCSELQQARERIAELEGILKIAKCPDCDGSGYFAHGPYDDGSWEQEQCQWCDERNCLLTTEGEEG